jgi:hypothetical protein
MTHSDDKNLRDKSKIASDDAATEGDSVDDGADAPEPNPPRTTSFGWLTVPKFGSASTGGGELEPGPERD